VPSRDCPTVSARSAPHGAFDANVRATRSARRAAEGSRELYEFAARVGDRFGVTHRVDLECGDGRQLVPWRSRFEVFGLDVPTQVEADRRRRNFGEWRAWSPNAETAWSDDVIEAAAVVWRAREAMSPPELACSRSTSCCVTTRSGRSSTGIGRSSRSANPVIPRRSWTGGWHHRYQRLRHRHQFVRDPDELVEFVDSEFYAQFLLPRLARIGVPLPPPRPRARARTAAIATMRRLWSPIELSAAAPAAAARRPSTPSVVSPGMRSVQRPSQAAA